MRRGIEYKYLVTDEEILSGMWVFPLIYTPELGGFRCSAPWMFINITGLGCTGCTG